MAILKGLGKKELKELGCRFIVANVPVFAAVSDAKKVNKMVVQRFNSLNEAKDFVDRNVPIIIFDQTGVYKEKANQVLKESNRDQYYLRYCKVTPYELNNIKENSREAGNVNYTFKFDFSCWEQ